MKPKHLYLLYQGAGFFLLFGLCATAWLMLSAQSQKDNLRALVSIWLVPALFFVVAAIVYYRGERCPRCGKRYTLEIEGLDLKQRRSSAGRAADVPRRCSQCGFLVACDQNKTE